MAPAWSPMVRLRPRKKYDIFIYHRSTVVSVGGLEEGTYPQILTRSLYYQILTSILYYQILTRILYYRVKLSLLFLTVYSVDLV